MPKYLLSFLFIIFILPAVFAFDGIAIGPYYGYSIPVGNMWVKPGPDFGLQARVSVISFLGVGAYYSSRAYGDVELVYFEGEPYEWTDYLDGGNVTSFGMKLYLGKTGGAGLNYFALGGISSHKWKRDYSNEDSKIAYSLGFGLEYVLPMNLGIEGRGIFEAASAGHKAMWRSAIMSVGVNYHFKFGPM